MGKDASKVFSETTGCRPPRLAQERASFSKNGLGSKLKRPKKQTSRQHGAEWFSRKKDVQNL